MGNRNPYPETDEEYGPLVSLLQARRYEQAYMFCTGSQYLEGARMVEEAASGLQDGCRFRLITMELDSPIDYVEILSKLKARVNQVQKELSGKSCRIFVLPDPGTPQMQTAWFLLAKSGELEATLLQGIPPRFAGGACKVKEVNLDSEVLPEEQAAWVDLEQGRRFRRDLYQRLDQTTLQLPSLRESKTDIPLLVRAILGRWNAQYRKEKRISEEAMRYLLEHQQTTSVPLPNTRPARGRSCARRSRRTCCWNRSQVFHLLESRRSGWAQRLVGGLRRVLCSRCHPLPR